MCWFWYQISGCHPQFLCFPHYLVCTHKKDTRTHTHTYMLMVGRTSRRASARCVVLVSFFVRTIYNTGKSQKTQTNKQINKQKATTENWTQQTNIVVSIAKHTHVSIPCIYIWNSINISDFARACYQPGVQFFPPIAPASASVAPWYFFLLLYHRHLDEQQLVFSVCTNTCGIWNALQSFHLCFVETGRRKIFVPYTQTEM